jgi:hypothetical protein
MKTLDQVEPRTPISSAPFTISTAGSYYLTGPLTVASGSGISINTDNVTLDLNGFTIASTSGVASGNGVSINGNRRNVWVRNGFIRGTTTFSGGVFAGGGFLGGVDGLGPATANLRVSEVSVAGVAQDGIDLGATPPGTSVVERCHVAVCGGNGIRAAVVHECLVSTAGGSGILAEVVRDSVGESVDAVTSSDGVAGASLVDHCRGVASAGIGVRGGQVRNSSALSVTATGLLGTEVQNSQGTSDTNVGLNASIALNCQGTSSTGSFGLNVGNGTVSFSRGFRPGGVAIGANTAIGCTAVAGSVVATKKFLGTP